MAQKRPGEALTTLAHFIDVDFLREAFRRVRKDGAVGVDGQTADEYAENLEANLQSLLDRFKTGNYRAPAVRRVWISKGRGKTRAIGIPTVEDKILQRAVAMVLTPVYEQDFLPCSWGFRPGRSAHQALQTLWDEAVRMGGGWVLEVDIQGFFDHLDHAHLRSFLDQRVRDGVLRRAIGKWLRAGVLEDGQLYRPKEGTPQGGVISPLLANIYLHVVLDAWMEHEVKPRMRGRIVLTRYADDLVILFAREADARRVLAVLPKRLEKYGLTLHPDKTRLVPFHRPRRSGREPSGGPRPGTFTFLGFTHYWGKSLKGAWIPKRKTSKESFRRGLQRVSLWLRVHRHWPIDVQHRRLVRMLQGHYAYFGVTGNADPMDCYRYRVELLWWRWLNRRSHRGRMPACRFYRMLERYPLPPLRVVHSIYRRAANPCA
ncbi:MAG: group II intron reverse transcriptase/maturase [Myxococcota bacterium]